MHTDKFLAGISAIILIVSAFWYSSIVWSNDIQPAVATFILATVVLLISEWTYWSKEGASILGNIALHAGAINVVLVTVTLLIRRSLDGDFSADFNNFQYVCMVVSLIILVLWKVTDKHAIGFCLIQAVALVAYLPTIARVLEAPTQTDSNVLWLAILLSSLAAVRPAINRFLKNRKDWLGLVYLGRTIPSNFLVVYLIAAKSFGLPPF